MKKSFSETLKQLRMDAGYTQKQVYEMIGVPQSTFSSWEVGKSEPSADILLKLCKIYGVNDVLSAFGYDGYNEDGSICLNMYEIDIVEKYRLLDDFGKETVQLAINRELKRSELIADQAKHITKLESTPIVVEKEKGSILRIYTYLHKIACAGNGFYFDDIPTDSIEAPYLEGADFIIGVNGDSMEPTFKDGDLVYVQKRQVVETGDIGVFFYNNECYIKEAGEDGLVSHNSKYKIIPGSERIQCIGKVLGKVKLAK